LKRDGLYGVGSGSWLGDDCLTLQKKEESRYSFRITLINQFTEEGREQTKKDLGKRRRGGNCWDGR